MNSLILKTLPAVNLKKKNNFFAWPLTHESARHGGDVLLNRLSGVKS